MLNTFKIRNNFGFPLNKIDFLVSVQSLNRNDPLHPHTDGRNFTTTELC